MTSTPDTLVCTLTANLPEPRVREVILQCDHATRLDGHAIGWMPFVAWEKRHAWGDLLALHRNDDLVGWCMMSKVSGYQELRCLQIWVRPDARMIEHGRALVDELNRLAWDRGAIVLRLWCAEDLPANLFWKQLGFRYRGWRWGKAKKGRRHALWMRRVVDPLTTHTNTQPRSRSNATAIWCPAATDARSTQSPIVSTGFNDGSVYNVASAS